MTTLCTEVSDAMKWKGYQSPGIFQGPCVVQMNVGISDDAELTGPLSVFTAITLMVDQMAALAWQKLGLQPDPLTGKLHRDLAEAKVAIDLTTHLAGYIEPKLDEDDKRRIHGLIRDLRINYVEKAKETE